LYPPVVPHRPVPFPTRAQAFGPAHSVRRSPFSH
jgi:hypothetical protein